MVLLCYIIANYVVWYRDWTIDQQLDDPSSSDIFNATYFGAANSSNMYIVDTGPMANFPVSNSPLDYVSWESPYGYLRGIDNYNNASFVSRMVGVSGQLASTADVDACLVQQNYSAFWICIWYCVISGILICYIMIM